jgi:hypothetical protein
MRWWLMADNSYCIVRRGKTGFDVEMATPDGRQKTVPGFASEHEANAWIIQAQRMIRGAGPWTPLAPRKPNPPAAAAQAPPAQPPVQDTRSRAARRAHTRAARELSSAKS